MILRDRSPRARVAAAATLLAATTALGLTFRVWHGYLDLMVYRLGAQTFLDGNDVYGPLPPLDGGIHLPFTYPPLAAIAFAPFAAMPAPLASAVMFALTLASIGVTVWLVLGRLRPTLDRGTRLAIVLAVVAAAQFLEPVRETLGFGQVNAILMAAVAVDVLTRSRRWPRGVLIGVAISIKLTPAGFLLLFLLRRDWRALAVTVASTAASIGLAWLIMPSDSHTYWFEKLRETGRIGAPYFAGNESIKGMVFRFGLSESAASLVWIGLSAVAVVLAAVWMRRLLADDRLPAALIVNAAAILLVSPVSWSHHWVWAVPALVIAVDAIVAGRRDRGFCIATGFALLMFAVGPHWLLPGSHDRELGWAWWQQIIGAAYVLFTFAVLAVGAWRATTRADGSPA
ncbi:membrane protein [Gordonia spumicola]|uniref:Membrane protein n=1 Tax=Gordonia spumicola TaxID=589161 RepID=A0A7I9VFA0_9ACTN|nr:glycosyltransferase 87 family protein [Gordonia spumicola]GEE04027.1 membrane protein [Gordonia spumicola]